MTNYEIPIDDCYGVEIMRYGEEIIVTALIGTLMIVSIALLNIM